MSPPVRLLLALGISGCLAVASVPYAVAQSADTRQELELKRQQKKPVVAPLPDAAQASKDVDDAALAAEREHRTDELLKRINPPQRPEMDETVTGGIQSENLRRLPKP